MPGLSVADQQRANTLCAQQQLQLEARGVRPDMARAGIRRAQGAAEFHTRYLSSGIRGQAYLETLVAEFAEIEGWSKSWIEGMEK